MKPRVTGTNEPVAMALSLNAGVSVLTLAVLLSDGETSSGASDDDGAELLISRWLPLTDTTWMLPQQKTTASSAGGCEG